MGVEQEDPVTRLLGADPPFGTEGGDAGLATVNLCQNVVLTVAKVPLGVSPRKRWQVNTTGLRSPQRVIAGYSAVWSPPNRSTLGRYARPTTQQP